jgi:hypothetical protein
MCDHVGLRRRTPSVRYPIRGLPPEDSLNQLIVDELTMAAGEQKPRADFSDLVGRWEPDPGFDEILAAQRRIDPAKWK